jgi:metal-dependent HD superfamily phosphatase/phosphodiesterase
MRKTLDFDPNTGISHVFNYDEVTDEAMITAEQDVSAVIEANKQAYNDAPDRHGEWSRVAQIPMVVYMDLKKQGILDDQAAMKKWLNDPDNRFFRTRPGTI